ncbi:UNVERIFIED_CONTAM: hypothetical protein Sradi_1776900 [Sesamum radiatum]|uniref:Uncharacterized protein n=1 Tax=Sesamum radiatum TaxID=300843 RepID=A0AAW2TU50_SESRA
MVNGFTTHLQVQPTGIDRSLGKMVLPRRMTCCAYAPVVKLCVRLRLPLIRVEDPAAALVMRGSTVATSNGLTLRCVAAQRRLFLVYLTVYLSTRQSLSVKGMIGCRADAS